MITKNTSFLFCLVAFSSLLVLQTLKTMLCALQLDLSDSKKGFSACVLEALIICVGLWKTHLECLLCLRKYCSHRISGFSSLCGAMQ